VPHIERVSENLVLLVGDLALSALEEDLVSQWSASLDHQPRAVRVLSAFGRVIQRAAHNRQAALILIDVPSSLDSLTRAALLAAEHIVIPLAPDFYSIQILRGLGHTLHRWRKEWTAGVTAIPSLGCPYPTAPCHPSATSSRCTPCASTTR